MRKVEGRERGEEKARRERGEQSGGAIITRGEKRSRRKLFRLALALASILFWI